MLEERLQIRSHGDAALPTLIGGADSPLDAGRGVRHRAAAVNSKTEVAGG